MLLTRHIRRRGLMLLSEEGFHVVRRDSCCLEKGDHVVVQRRGIMLLSEEGFHVVRRDSCCPEKGDHVVVRGGAYCYPKEGVQVVD